MEPASRLVSNHTKLEMVMINHQIRPGIAMVTSLGDPGKQEQEILRYRGSVARLEQGARRRQVKIRLYMARSPANRGRLEARQARHELSSLIKQDPQVH